MEKWGSGEAVFSLVVLLFLFWTTASGLLSPKGVNFEVQALMDIKDFLEDPHDILENWDQDSVDPCSWTMVTCSAENLVIGLGTPSQNLSGTLSPSIGNLTNLLIVLLQNNNISGQIPAEIGKLQKLHTLDLSNNLLTGKIPNSLGQLNKLEYLKLNNNSLSDAIPPALVNLTQLAFLDLSCNNLSGPVPSFPARRFSIVGNPLICATGKERDCNGTEPMLLSSMNNSLSGQSLKRPTSHKLALAVGTSIGCICLLFLGFGILLWRRHKNNKQKFFDVNDKHHEEVSLGNLKRFQFRELQIATNNFSNKNILGKGGFGIVYKGSLQDGTVVAVKRLTDGNAAGGEIQFQTEVEMISLAVHRNLLRLCGFCMTATERLLIYPYMSNGSVASRLKGAFPMYLANMTQLGFLDLSYNNLSGPVPRFPARTFNIVGNPMICATGSEQDCYGTEPMPLSFNLNNSQSSQPSGRPRSHKVAFALGTSLGGICLLIFGFGLLLWWRQRYNQQIFFDVNDQHHEEVCLGNLKRFNFRELQIATDNFSSKNIVGKGGFGVVYKGNLQDGTVVAVKRLKDGNAVGGEIQFQTEVEMISLAVHRNLLRLCGFCMTSTERLLIYPYMSNGSVASRLKEKPALDWGTRKRIALGAARGLLYLHEQCDPKIIHRDVKAANILLDDYCEAVVGDFGLAKLLDHRDSHVTTAVRGTVGHIAPEYLSTGQSSEKTDAFGFGILLLELITGQRALEFGKAANQKGVMLDWVKNIHREKKLDMLVDKDLKSNYDRIELEEMVRVALLCTQFLPGQRPKMSEVMRMLEGDGLAERWEASQRAEANKCRPHEFSSSERYSDLTDDSSLLVQAMELSGPR